MQLSLTQFNNPANSKEKLEVADRVFNDKFNEPLIHQVVTACLANIRQGTHAQKNRAAVRGGGKKPWKQKGSGRARAGTSRSPIWRKGGVTFAAQTQDYSQKINKKMYRAAMRSILSELVRQDRLIVVDTFSAATPKTRDMLKKLNEMKLDRALLILDEVSENVYLATRNLINIDVCDVAAADPVSLVHFDKVLITTIALKQFEEALI